MLRALGGEGELWVRHSLAVGRICRLIATALGDRVDPDLFYCAGVLHDIGRARTHGVWHPWEGWRILTGRGETTLARPALTHWLKGRSRRRVAATAPGLDPERMDRIYALVPPRPPTLLDLAVSVADGFVAHDRVVPMAERYADLRKRYAASAWLRDSERIGRGQLGRLQALAGVDLHARILEDEEGGGGGLGLR